MAFDDWGEMQTVPWVLGIPHPTGYPTYVMAAWLFEQLPARRGRVPGEPVLGRMHRAGPRDRHLDRDPARRPPAIAGRSPPSRRASWISGVGHRRGGQPAPRPARRAHPGRSLAWARPSAPGPRPGGLLSASRGEPPLTVLVAPHAVAFVALDGPLDVARAPALAPRAIVTGLVGLSAYLYLPIAASLIPARLQRPGLVGVFRFLVTGEQFRGQYAGLLPAFGPATSRVAPQLWGVARRGPRDRRAPASPVRPCCCVGGPRRGRCWPRSRSHASTPGRTTSTSSTTCWSRS